MKKNLTCNLSTAILPVFIPCYFFSSLYWKKGKIDGFINCASLPLVYQFGRNTAIDLCRCAQSDYGSDWLVGTMSSLIELWKIDYYELLTVYQVQNRSQGQ